MWPKNLESFVFVCQVSIDNEEINWIVYLAIARKSLYIRHGHMKITQWHFLVDVAGHSQVISHVYNIVCIHVKDSSVIASLTTIISMKMDQLCKKMFRTKWAVWKCFIHVLVHYATMNFLLIFAYEQLSFFAHYTLQSSNFFSDVRSLHILVSSIQISYIWAN